MVEGDSHSFSVSVTGAEPLAYQWRRDGVELPGKTAAALSLSAIQTNDAGFYSVAISNIEGAVTSAPVRLSVRLASDPLYPAPHLGWAYLFGGDGASNSFTEALDGTWNYEVQPAWDGEGRGAGVGLAGGVGTTNGILTIEDAVFSNATGFNNRRYYFTHNLAQEGGVTNATTLLNDGVTLTFRARLTPPSDPLIELTNAPNGLVNNSDGKGMFGIRQSGNSGLIISFSLNQATEDTSSTASFHFSQAGLHMNNLNGNTRTANVDPGEAGIINLRALDPTVFHEFWITIEDNGADAGTHRVSVYMDGATTPAVFNVTAGSGVDGPAANYLALGMGSSLQRGAVDVDFFGYQSGAILPPAFNQPVGFILQPSNQVVALGVSAAFGAGVTGTPPYAVQWYRDGVAVENATNLVYTTPPATAEDEGAQFTVVVSNEFNAVTSSPPAVLQFLSPPVIVTQPQSLVVTNGDNAGFSVSATSAVTPSYQWRRNGGNLPNANASSLLIPGASAADMGSYDVVVSNSSGSVTSSPATLLVVSFDLGDAPDPGFPTLKASGGAQHLMVGGIHLGAGIDADANGQPGALANGDDLAGIDDEDGVNFLSLLRAGQTATVEVVASTAGLLDAWIDFDRNGSWSGAGEQVFTSQSLAAGTNVLPFAVPGLITSGSAHARFRFSTAGGLSFDGVAADGEVEDYAVSLQAAADLRVTQSDGPDPVATQGQLTYSITVHNNGPSAATAIMLSNALPSGVSFVSVLASQGNCDLAAGVLTCSAGTLAPGTAMAVTLVVSPNSAGSVTNTVVVSAAELDLASGNNTASSVSAVLDPPSIDTQPQGQSVVVGDTVNFSVAAAGGGLLNYQWRKDGDDLAGATNASLTLLNAQPADEGIYRVQITNLVGSVESQTATLTVLMPPAITVQPQSRTNFAGSTATFGVTATGTAPLSYRWLFNSTNVIASDVMTLVLPTVQLTNAGNYRVAVSNAAGTVLSEEATLTVFEMDFGDAPDGYPTTLAANGARHLVAAGIHLGVATDFEAEGQVNAIGQGDDLSGLDDEDGVTFTTAIRAGEIASVAVVASTNGFLNAWLDFARDGSWAEAGDQIFTNRVLLPGTNELTFGVPPAAAGGSSFARFRFATVGGLSFVGQANDGEVEDHAASILTRGDVLVAGVNQLNPTAVGSNQVYTITVSNAGPSTATGVALSDLLPPGQVFVSALASEGNCIHSAGVVACALNTLAAGAIRTVAITVVPQAAGLLTNVVTVGADQGDPDSANNTVISVASALVVPEIMGQPQSLTLTNGGMGSFSVLAGGSALSYQWRLGAAAIPGATNATLTITNAQPADAGDYSVTVSNAVGAVTSDSVLLTVLVPVTISTPPASVTVTQGSTATFSVVAAGSAPLGYQWEFDGGELSGETQSSLVLNDVQASQAGTYRVRVSNPAGSVLSAPAALTVRVPPSFVVQPQSQTNRAGLTATFSATAAGTEPMVYQWYFNVTNQLAHETNASLILPDLRSSLTGGYAVVASNIAGVATSSVAVLTVYEVDFGDAPESLGYPTAMDFNGARHRLLPGVRLGQAADFETNGQPDLTATGDDGAGIDDEDGVSFPSALLIGQLVNVAVVASTNGFVDAWIDFNANGTWSDSSEQVLVSRPVSAGTNLVAVPISASALLGNAFARFRFSTAGGLAYDGFAPDGEVEDYLVAIQSAIDLAVWSTDAPDPVPVLGTVGYSVVVTNRGPSVGTSVVLTNILPGSFTFLSANSSQGTCSNDDGTVSCALGTVPVGGSATVTLSARADSPGTFTVSSRVTGSEGEANPGDNSFVQQTSAVVPAVGFGNPVSVAIADGTGSGPGTGSPYPSTILVSGLTGTVFKVTVTLNNLNHTFAGDLDVLLVGPGGQSVLLMSDAGGGFVLSAVTPTFDDEADISLPSGGVISSTRYRPTAFDPSSDAFPPPAPTAPFGNALSVFKGTNPNGAWSLYVLDDESSDTGTLSGGWSLNIATADPMSDLGVVGDASSNPVGVNSNLVYFVAVTNHGPSSATGVVLSNLLPAGVTFISAVASQGICAQQDGVVTCEVGGLNPGGRADIAITVLPTLTGMLTNTFGATGTRVDLVSSNNLASVVTAVRPVTDLVIEQTASTDLIVLGQELTYTLNVTNRGPVAGSNVRLSAPLPLNATFISANPTQGSCTNESGVIQCDLGTLAAGASATVLLTILPNATGHLSNSVSVAADEIDSAAADNLATGVTVVNVAADLEISMNGSPDPVGVGQALTYSIAVTNLGPSTAGSVLVSNVLPATVSFVSAVPSQGDCVNDGGAIHCALGTLTMGAGAQVILTVIPNASGSLTNVAGVGAGSLDLSPANNSTERVISVQVPPFIVTAPQSQTVTNGVNTALAVVAGGTAPLSFQWQFNGVDIDDATNAILALDGVTFLNGGEYRVRVSNQVGNVFSESATLTVLVPPTISDLPDQQVDEDASTAAIPFTIGDVDSPVDGLTLTRLSSNPLLVPPENIAVTGAGANRQVVVTPAPHQSGTVTITIEVRDGNGLAAADSFLLTVQSVNDLPVISELVDQSTAEDSPLSVTFSAADVETLPGDLDVVVVSSNEGLVAAAGISLERTGTNWLMTLSPLMNQSGTATISVTVTDTNGAVAGDQFVLTVNAVNDPPTLDPLPDLTIMEDGGPQSVALSGISSGAADEGQGLALAVTSSDTNLVANPSILYTNGQSTGILSFSSATNMSGNVTLTVTLDDGGASNNIVVRLAHVTVVASNDLPVISAIDDQVMDGNTSLNVDFLVADVETGLESLAISTLASNTALLPAGSILVEGSGTSRSLRITPATGLHGVSTIDVTVRDSDDAVVTRSFLLTVRQVIFPPAIVTQPQARTVTNGAAVTFIVEASGTAPLSYQWSRNGEELPGRTESTLALPAVQASDAGNYTVQVSNGAGAATSAPAALRVLVSPSLLLVSRVGTTATISFPSEAGLIYTLEHKDNFDAIAWLAGASGPGTGSTVVLIDSDAGVSSRVYRVRVE